MKLEFVVIKLLMKYKKVERTQIFHKTKYSCSNIDISVYNKQFIC